MSTIHSLKKAMKADPLDMTLRLVYADALEELAKEECSLQRLVVLFVKRVSEVIEEVNAKLHATPTPIGVTEGPVNIKVYVVGGNYRYTYAIIRKSDGAVFRGCKSQKEGPVRFSLYDPEKWGPHLGAFGLNYLAEME